jgi:hypothetical protein
MSLKAFIKQQNDAETFWASHSGRTPMLLPQDPVKLTGAQRVALAKRLSCSLSPENLCCDGELRGAKLQAKSRLLYKAKEELEGLMGMAIPAY